MDDPCVVCVDISDCLLKLFRCGHAFSSFALDHVTRRQAETKRRPFERRSASYLAFFELRTFSKYRSTATSMRPFKFFEFATARDTIAISSKLILRASVLST